MKIEDFDDMLRQMGDVTAPLWEGYLINIAEHYGEVCESHIELFFLAGLVFKARWSDDVISHTSVHYKSKVPAQVAAEDMFKGGARVLAVYPQMQIKDYRVDFGLLYRAADNYVCGAVVECDGHDYHYNTKEKVSADRLRDRDLQEMGFRVMRFPGRDIRAEVYDCVDHALNFVGAVYCADELDRKRPPHVIAEKTERGLMVLGRRVFSPWSGEGH